MKFVSLYGYIPTQNFKSGPRVKKGLKKGKKRKKQEKHNTYKIKVVSLYALHKPQKKFSELTPQFNNSQ